MTIDNESIRVLERESIRLFVEREARQIEPGKRLLDFACGKQPYRSIIEDAGIEYHGHDRVSYPANVSQEDIGEHWPFTRDWDVILNTQMIQYIPPWHVSSMIEEWRAALYVKRGVLLMTGPTTWPLVEPQDFCRYTPAGVYALLTAVGFLDVEVQPRASIEAGSVGLVIGWWAKARVR